MRKTDSFGRTRVVGAFVLLLGAATVCQAQVVARSLDDLRLKVGPGDTIYVTDHAGREQRVRVLNISASALVVSAALGPRELTERDIVQIRKRTADPLLTGALIGGGIGAALGALAAATSDECSYDSSSCVGPVLSMLGVGAACGIGIDALIQKRRVIYDAARPSTRVSVTPVIGRTGAAVMVSVRR